MMRPLWNPVCVAIAAGVAHEVSEAQEVSKDDERIQVFSPNPAANVRWNFERGTLNFTNGATMTFSNMVLQAESGSANLRTSDAEAQGNVMVKQDGQLWRGESVRLNFETEALEADAFRVGSPPFFAEGDRVTTDTSGARPVYRADRAYLTTDDIADPALKIRVKELALAPDDYVEGRSAVMELYGVPLLYFPRYRHDLELATQRYNVEPGYRSKYGAYLLNSYNWYSRDQATAAIQLDYRTDRGVGIGQEVAYDLGRWGSGAVSGYYLDDQQPEKTPSGALARSDRHRFTFSHSATLRPLLTVKTTVHEQSDRQVNREFFEGDHQRNTQPKSFVEVQQQWPNYALTLDVRPQIDGFFETVERLPEIRFSSFRQQIGRAPLYYEGESSAALLRRRFADSDPALDYEALRADTFHQVVSPQMIGGFLNFVPRVGLRMTHYSEAHGLGATTSEQQRWVFNTGAEMSTKISRTWPGVKNTWLKLDGLRHIVTPSINYAFVPNPDVDPSAIPQFDRRLPSLRLLPIEFPDFNAIDSIDSQNVVRLGLRNLVQTKREGRVENLVNWAIFSDWRMDPNAGQATFSDVYSEMDLRPRSWISLNSEMQYDIQDDQLSQANHSATWLPNDVWSWSVGHRYLKDGIGGLGSGNSLVYSSLYYRINENWGTRLSHFYEARDGVIEEQDYSIYRDFRSWVGAVSFRIRDQRDGETDFAVMFRFSLKAMPRYSLGDDRDLPNYLMGGRREDYEG